jgi:hypothetical protein
MVTRTVREEAAVHAPSPIRTLCVSPTLKQTDATEQRI